MKKGGLRKDKRDQLLCVIQSQHLHGKKLLLSFSTAGRTYIVSRILISQSHGNWQDGHHSIDSGTWVRHGSVSETILKLEVWKPETVHNLGDLDRSSTPWLTALAQFKLHLARCLPKKAPTAPFSRNHIILHWRYYFHNTSLLLFSIYQHTNPRATIMLFLSSFYLPPPLV